MSSPTRFRFLLPVIFAVVTSVSGFIDTYGHGRIKSTIPSGLTEDDALFLSPYIEKGQIEKGQDLAEVPPLLKDVESFAGYLTVNKTYNSNLFFWLFKTQQGDWKKVPTVVWLQGGPGVSSLFGLFTELGPFSVTTKQKLKRRKWSWNRKYNLVFFDQPVGSGYSFTKDDQGYARNEIDVARDLYEALVQLHKLFPSLQRNKLIITGESYAGKYIPAIGYKIYQENQVSSFKINLGGLMIGNGFTSPGDMLHYSSFLYQIGLIDGSTRRLLEGKEDQIRAHIRAGQWLEAMADFNLEFGTIMSKIGFQNPYDFTNDKIGIDGPEVQFIQNEKTRKAIHVGSHAFNDYYKPYMFLSWDFMQSVKPWVEELLTAQEFPILFYSGQLDIIVAYPLSVAFYDSLKWPGALEYHKAERCIFQVGREVAGYFKTAGTFTEVMVRNTGHMVPTTQPEWAFALLDRFITNSSSFTCSAF